MHLLIFLLKLYIESFKHLVILRCYAYPIDSISINNSNKKEIPKEALLCYAYTFIQNGEIMELFYTVFLGGSAKAIA